MKRGILTLIFAGIIVAMILLLSPLFVRWWHGPAETPATPPVMTFTGQATIAELAKITGLELPKLLRALQAPPSTSPAQSLDALGISPATAKTSLQRAMALRAQEATKDWRKIVSKFVLLAIFLTGAIYLLKRRRITPSMRLLLLLVALLIFGVVYGADQSPMGTVKDTLVLWGKNHLLFPPRLIALGVFLLMVILANKSICGWGCQFGVLQDLLFHLNRDAKSHGNSILPQVKLPFAVTNSIRILVVLITAGVALTWGIDLIEPVNPFNIYNPASLTIIGAVAIGVLLVASLFIYRPWCHLACPFGLLGWLVERFSRQRVRVDYNACVACGACARACPSMVMTAILHQERVTPDCFACGNCITTCPQKAITFDSQPRMPIPEGKFTPKQDDAVPDGTDPGSATSPTTRPV